MKLLLVDDNINVTDRIIKALADIEVGITIAGRHGTEDGALECIDATPGGIDAAIIELQLAQGTGFGVIRRLRKPSGRTAPTIVIVLTKHAVPALKVAAFEAGADYFLDKGKHGMGELANLFKELLTNHHSAVSTNRDSVGGFDAANT
jgi:DNA-binding response OmpR family regulator